MFKVGDIVCLTNGNAPMHTFTEWAQKMINDKTRCKVTHVDGDRVGVRVIEGEREGKEFSSSQNRFKKLGVYGLEVEEL